MTAQGSHSAPAVLQPSLRAAFPPRPTPMRVSLAFVEQRVNVWLRFGPPAREIVLDRWRRVAVFAPGAVCCRVKWIGNDYGTALWQLMVLQAPTPCDDAQRVAGVQPGACILLRADGQAQVKAVLAVIDAIEALDIDPCAVAVTYWRMVGNRLAARQPVPAYTAERHAAQLARKALQ
ncbi:MAG: transposase [Burkholderiales bacterium 68-12]|nr:MAG: transposase [Burkholderiales bacterium 68-12]